MAYQANELEEKCKYYSKDSEECKECELSGMDDKMEDNPISSAFAANEEIFFMIHVVKEEQKEGNPITEEQYGWLLDSLEELAKKFAGDINQVINVTDPAEDEYQGLITIQAINRAMFYTITKSRLELSEKENHMTIITALAMEVAGLFKVIEMLMKSKTSQ